MMEVTRLSTGKVESWNNEEKSNGSKGKRTYVVEVSVTRMPRTAIEETARF